MVRSNSLMRLVLPFLAALTAIMLGGMACGPAGGISGGSGNSASFILEDAEYVTIAYSRSLLEARELPGVMLGDGDDTEDVQDRILSDWEGDSSSPSSIHLDEVSAVTIVLLPKEGNELGGYGVTEADFLSDDLVEELEGEGYEEDAYRDFPVWRKEYNDVYVDVVVVFPEDGFIVNGPEAGVRGYLKALDREEGFATGDHDLERVLSAAGNGLWSWAYGDCESEYVDDPPRLSETSYVSREGASVL